MPEGVGEEGDGGEGEEVSVFSRANHFHSLGISETSSFVTASGVIDSETLGGNEDSAILKTNNTSQQQTRKQGGIEAGGGLVPDPRGSGDMEWDQFKSDFMRGLQSQGEKEVKEDGGNLENRLPLEALSQLLSSVAVNTDSAASRVTDVHNGGSSESNERETQDSKSDTQAGISANNHNGVLSTDLLEEINMSALDRALELVDAEGASRTADSSEARHLHAPKPAWEESQGGAPDLLSQLVEIRNSTELQTKERGAASKEQSSEPAVHSILTEATGNDNSGGNESENKPVYIDLRKPTPRSEPQGQ